MKGVRIVCIGILFLAVVAIAMRAIVIKIEPGQAGVLNPELVEGLVEEDYGPGFHWDIGPLHTWTVFDTTVQTLHMNKAEQRGSRGSRRQIVPEVGVQTTGPLQFKSAKGATIEVDVTLKYRIKPKHAWKVLTKHGAGDRYKERVRNVSLDVMRASLGGLNAEDFYEAARREESTADVAKRLTTQLDSEHVELIGVLIRDITFDEGFEKRIKEKTLAVEEQQLNIAQTRAADARGKTNKIAAETEALVSVMLEDKEKQLAEMRAENNRQIANLEADYRLAVEKLKSDADLYAAQQEASAIQLRKDAEAKGQTLTRSALSGKGGDYYVALELVRGLKLEDMTVSTQATDPLDVEGILERFGIKK